MQETEKYFDAENLVDEVLITEPGFSLPDNFADMVADKVSRKFAWQQYIKEFFIYLGAFAGIAIIFISIALKWYDINWNEWFDFIWANISLIIGISIIAIFVLFTDRVVLRYFMFKADVETV
ncbi:MAG: hypothetical protein GQ525_00065 [Draconibacterium sp.]|nr:hypothetical protein [Draconibacterium sp.]